MIQSIEKIMIKTAQHLDDLTPENSINAIKEITG
jgi:hypothetical protein